MILNTSTIILFKMLKGVGESRHPWRTSTVVLNHSPMLLSACVKTADRPIGSFCLFVCVCVFVVFFIKIC